MGIALVGALCVASTSWACSIAFWYHIVPGMQQTDVPLNARVSTLIFNRPGLSFSWLREGSNGSVENVPFKLTWRPGDGMHENAELVPESPLAANSRYRIELKQPGVEPSTITSFTTGTSQDGTPPVTPAVTVGKIIPYVPPEEASGAECFVGVGFSQLTFRSEGAATYLLREGETVLAAGLPEDASLAFSCPAADRKIQATLTAIDVAGNMSKPVPVSFEQRCSKESRLPGCSASGGAGGLLLTVLAWSWLAWRRRRASALPVG
jgi:uncharacterized protein (TIGR03382 family)